MRSGLKVCETGICKDNSNTDTFVNVNTGRGAIDALGSIGGSWCANYGVTFQAPRSGTSKFVWVFGVKPPEGTQGVSRFSTEQWSQYSASSQPQTLSPIIPRTMSPQTLAPGPSGQQEVYLQALTSEIPLNIFDRLKASFFPSNPNITLATVDQINNAMRSGLKVCETGICKDNSNTDIFVNVSPGRGSIDAGGSIAQSSWCDNFGVTFQAPRSGTSKFIWVFGVKPPEGTRFVSRFSTEQWSQYSGSSPQTLPPRPSGQQEVYLQILGRGMTPSAGQFQNIKSSTPEYSGITLATISQIQEALRNGLMVCESGLAIDNNNSEVIATTATGGSPINATSLDSGSTGNATSPSPGSCFRTKAVYFDFGRGFTTRFIWVYGVKPPNGTFGILPFAYERWSFYDVARGR